MDIHVSEALLGVIAMALSAGVKVLSNVLGSLRDLNLKIGIIIEQVKDHEQRMRVVETPRRGK
jgi:flagellar biosynthesis/type III secretory pathway chaperone